LDLGELMWIKSIDKKPSNEMNMVLGLCWIPFFGKLVPEQKVVYYDDPEDYSDKKGDGWLTWDGNQKVKVSHWMPLPAEPVDSSKSIEQTGLNLDTLGNLKL
jgi:hypothetical protein